MPIADATTWKCSVCCLVAGEPLRDAPTAEARCVECGEGPDPCALVRLQLAAATRQNEELRQALAVPGRATSARSAVEEAMDAEEAAGYLRLPSVRALYQAVRRGLVPAHKLGRRLRFLRAELDAVLVRGR